VAANRRRFDDERFLGKRMRILIFTDLGGAAAAPRTHCQDDHKHKEDEAVHHHQDSTCFDS
jgi:hypothetical protein